jgi:hypothetical protein
MDTLENVFITSNNIKMNVSALLPSGHQMLSNCNEILITLDPVINHENNLAINRESSTRKFEA